MNRMLVRAILGFTLALSGALSFGSTYDLVDYACAATGLTREEIVHSYATGIGNDIFLPFDGTTFSSDANFCWRGTLSEGPYIQFYLYNTITFPQCIGYRVHRLSTGWYSRDRSPTAWTVAISSNNVDWTTIDTQTDVDWSGDQTYPDSGGWTIGNDPVAEDCMKEFMLSEPSFAFKFIRFTPTASKRHTEKAESSDVGLMEVEFIVNENTIGSLTVNYGRNGISPYRGGVFSHSDGISFSSSATVTAPSFAIDDSGIVFACCGYRLEELGDDGWGNAQTIALRTFDYVPEANRHFRLTWLWEQVGYANVSLTELLQSQEIVPTYEGASTAWTMRPGFRRTSVLTASAIRTMRIAAGWGSAVRMSAFFFRPKAFRAVA